MSEELRTKTGKILTDADIQALADEAEIGYCVTSVGGKLCGNVLPCAVHDDTAAREDTYADMVAKRFADRVEDIAKRLERVAADVRRRKAKPNLRTLRPDFAYAAHEVIHDVMWAMANLNLDDLVTLAQEATEADAARFLEAEQ